MTPQEKQEKKSAVIIGAGIPGLSIGRELGKKGFCVTILDKSKAVGGIASSIRYNGYTMDIGPHYVTLPKHSKITEDVKNIIGENNLEILPFNIRRLRKAYFHGKMWNEFPTINEFMLKSNFKTIIQLGFNVINVKIKKSLKLYHPITAKDYLIENYSDFLYNNWFRQYFQNLFLYKEPSRETVEKQFPPIDFRKIFNKFSAKNKKQKINTSNNNSDYFHCYFKGGMITLIEALEKDLKKMNGKIETNIDIQSIEHNPDKKIISYLKNDDMNKISADIVVYALPLGIVKNWFKKSDIEKNISDINALSSIMNFLFIDSPKMYNKWIIDVYDNEFSSWRISQQSFLSKTVVPLNKTLLTVEIRIKANDLLWSKSDDFIFKKIKNDLEKMGILKGEKIDGYKILKIKNIYPLNPERTKDNTIRDMINSHKNEYVAGIDFDSEKLVLESESKKSNSTRLGGVFRAMFDAKILVSKIIENN